MTAIDYTCKFMWGSTDYSADNEADRITRFTIDRGRESLFSGRINPYNIGTLRMEVDNHDGRYDPWNASGDIYGDIKPGVNMQFYATYGTTDTYYLFTGKIDDVTVNGYNNTAILVCKDGWNWMRNQDFRVIKTTTDSLTYSSIITEAIADYPWGTSLSTSTDVPHNYYYDGDVKDFVGKIAESYLGRAWVDNQGDLNFAAPCTTSASIHTFTASELHKSYEFDMPWDNYYSEIRQYAVGYNITGSTDAIYSSTDYHDATYPTTSTLYPPYDIRYSVGAALHSTTNPNPYPTTANTTINYYSYQNPLGTYPPLPSSDYKAIIYDQDDVATYWYILTNNAPSTNDLRYVTFELYGEPVVNTDSAVYVQNSTDATLPDNRLEIGNFFTSIQYCSTTYKDNTEDTARVENAAKILMAYVSEIKRYPTIRIRGNPSLQFSLDLEDTVTLNAPSQGLIGNYWISKISHESVVNTQDVLTTLWLYPEMTEILSGGSRDYLGPPPTVPDWW